MLMSHWVRAAWSSVTAITLAGYTHSSAIAAGPELDPGQHQTGPAPCAKVLWVGGYRSGIQQGDCDRADPRKKPKKPRYTDKDKQLERRDAWEFWRQEKAAAHQAKKDRQEQERKDREAKKAAEKAKRDEEKFRREVEKAKEEVRKEHEARKKACRGLGLPADCDLANPGKGHGKSPGKEAR